MNTGRSGDNKHFRYPPRAVENNDAVARPRTLCGLLTSGFDAERVHGV